MCLAIPAEVVALLDGGRARVSLGGITKEISLALVDDVTVGDYVLLHVGFALGKIDADEARRTLEVLAASGELADELRP
ncbi:MAG: HypC/HybG/HupF family hydrogenase formation chaperone [Rhodanobacteraceae bacterium]|nr:HypC/HybG/HupF family hydrogenase formation chaperone [Rhodanobacteraceae bacterium]